MKLVCYSYMELDKHSTHVVALLMDPRNADELVHLLSQRIEQVWLDGWVGFWEDVRRPGSFAILMTTQHCL